MKARITNLTKSTIVLNKMKIVLGAGASQVVDVVPGEQKAELDGLDRANVIGIVEIIPKSLSEVTTEYTSTTITKAPPNKNKGGRPKGSKNKSKVVVAQTEQDRIRAAEAITQREEGRVVISTGEHTFETKMRKSYTDNMPESEATKASIDALAKLESEERDGNIDPIPVDESKLDPSDQTGRQATIIREGTHQKVDLTNNFANSTKKGQKASDPFIDREANAQREAILKKQASPLINDDGKEHSDAFIE